MPKNVANRIFGDDSDHKFACITRMMRGRKFQVGLADVRLSCYCDKKQQEQGNDMRVLGIDPGLRNMGWGLIDVTGSRLAHVANGVCRSPVGDLATRLVSLHQQLTAIVAQFTPDTAAVELTFVNRDGAGSLKLGQARGIAMLVPAQAGMSVSEYAPNAVKKAVVGVGHADKSQVAHMVKMQLPGVEISGADAADALAIAICHSHHAQSAGRLADAIVRAAE